MTSAIRPLRRLGALAALGATAIVLAVACVPPPTPGGPTSTTIGVTTTTIGTSTTIEIPRPRVTDIDPGGSFAAPGFTCAVVDGGARCWGDNSTGQLGTGTGPGTVEPGPTVTGLGSGVRAVTAGRAHACALTSAGGVECWGSNERGQLGRGTVGAAPGLAAPVTGLTSGVRQVSAGNDATCAVTDAGAVWCWGDGRYYQLGREQIEPAAAPVQVLELGTSVVSVVVGELHACAVLTGSGQVRCWGYGGQDQLGLGRPVAYEAVPQAVLTWARLINPSGVAIDVRVPFAGAVSLSATRTSTCAAITAGSVYCWGTPREVGAGAAAASQRFDTATKQPAAGGISAGATALAGGTGHHCAIVAGGVSCWGETGDALGRDGVPNDYFPRTTSLTGDVLEIAAGSTTSCALVAGDVAMCWGDGGDGQLGFGDRSSSDVPRLVTVPR